MYLHYKDMVYTTYPLTTLRHSIYCVYNVYLLIILVPPIDSFMAIGKYMFHRSTMISAAWFSNSTLSYIISCQYVYCLLAVYT